MPITLRKKAPFTCRAAGHHAHPLTESDGTLCPMHEAERKAAITAHEVKTHEASLAIVAATVDESPNWRPSGRIGPIWPTAEDR